MDMHFLNTALAAPLTLCIQISSACGGNRRSFVYRAAWRRTTVVPESSSCAVHCRPRDRRDSGSHSSGIVILS